MALATGELLGVGVLTGVASGVAVAGSGAGGLAPESTGVTAESLSCEEQAANAVTRNSAPQWARQRCIKTTPNQTSGGSAKLPAV